MSPSHLRSSIQGALSGLGLGVLSGILLPVLFISCSTDSTFRLQTILPIVFAIGLVYGLFCAGLGAWIGWAAAERRKTDPEFRLIRFVLRLGANLMEVKAYRMITVAFLLMVLAGGIYSAYLRWTGTAECLQMGIQNGQEQCVRYSWLFSR